MGSPSEDKLLAAFREIEDGECQYDLIKAAEAMAFVSSCSQRDNYARSAAKSPNKQESQIPGDLNIPVLLRSMRQSLGLVMGVGSKLASQMDEAREMEDNPNLRREKEEEKRRKEERTKAHLAKKYGSK